MNANPYINHCCINQAQLDQAFLDQSSGEYKKGNNGPYKKGFVRLGEGTYKHYTEWVYHADDTVTFVRDMCPRTIGIIEGALSADRHQLERCARFLCRQRDSGREIYHHSQWHCPIRSAAESNRHT